MRGNCVWGGRVLTKDVLDQDVLGVLDVNHTDLEHAVGERAGSGAVRGEKRIFLFRTGGSS